MACAEGNCSCQNMVQGFSIKNRIKRSGFQEDKSFWRDLFLNEKFKKKKKKILVSAKNGVVDGLVVRAISFKPSLKEDTRTLVAL